MKHHYIATLPWKLSFKATQFEIPWEQEGQLSPKGFVWTILDDGVQRVWKPFQKAESRVNRLCSKQCWIMTMKTWTAIIVFFWVIWQCCSVLDHIYSNSNLETHLSLIYLFMLNWIIHESYNHTMIICLHFCSIATESPTKTSVPVFYRCQNPRHFSEDNQSDVWGWEVIQAAGRRDGGFRGVFQQGFFFEVRFDMSNGETRVVYRVLLRRFF